jgi:hypothetical protein
MKKLLLLLLPLSCCGLSGDIVLSVCFEGINCFTQIPGPSQQLYNSQPYYTCNTNRHVSTTGSSGNSGLDAAHPWDLATAVAWNASASGSGSWCINLAPGTYSVSGGLIGLSAVVLTNGGTSASKTGLVVWRCTTMPFSFSGGALEGEGSGCLIQLTPGTSNSAVIAISDHTSYMVFDALEVQGINNNATTNQGPCLLNDNGHDPGTPNNTTTSHHFWILNSDLHGCGGSGIQWDATDWLFVIHNVWHDNSLTAASDQSGFSFYQAAGLTGYSPTVGNPDYWHSATTGRTYRIVVNYNVGVHNYNNFAGSTDGEGIILDDWSWSQGGCNVGTSGATCPYDGDALVMGNIMWGNGGVGIFVAFSAEGTTPSPGHYDIYNNTTYSNSWDPNNTGTFGGGLLANRTQLVTWRNNIAITVSGSRTCVNTGLSCTVLDQVGPNNANNDTWNNNLSYPATPSSNISVGNGVTFPTVGVNKNLDGTDPRLASLNPITSAGGSAVSNFALCTAVGVPAAGCAGASPAIGFGRAFDLWPQTGSIDAGACTSGLTSCP